MGRFLFCLSILYVSNGEWETVFLSKRIGRIWVLILDGYALLESFSSGAFYCLFRAIISRTEDAAPHTY